MTDNTDPRTEYLRRIEERRTESAQQFQRFRKVGFVRLALLGIGLILLWRVFAGLSAWWLVLPAVLFVVLGRVQARISAARLRCERGARLYEQGLVRLDDRWAGTGATGDRFLDPEHPCARDLDLFGRGSLFELLSTGRTDVGEETLAQWLLTPADLTVVRARQEAVTELRPKLDLREELALLGEGAPSGESARGLAAWANSPYWNISPWTRPIAIVISLLTIATLLLWFAGYSPIPFLLVLIIRQVYLYRLQKPVERVISEVDGPSNNLSLLSDVLKRLENERYESALLRELRAALDVDDSPPSKQIARLNRLIELLDSRRNIIFAPAAAILLWPLQCAISIERWRQSSGPVVGRWLAAVGEFEALNSFASYAYEHPHDPFPELLDSGDAHFEAISMGHPLIPARRNVRTDLSLTGDLRVLIVSGSNMSGKSTLLRSVGINVVLALAGAPVRAGSLRLTPVQVGAAIRIQDSLQAGASRFYAEITRLRQVVGLTEDERPVLFLLDEILHGTNSHDRQIGAEKVVHGLIDRGAIGLITTHDLALARIVDELAPRAANVHFEDQFQDGQMRFDYLLRPGVVQRSNALELMRSVGLEV
ncbi:MAG: DNA mismatch repair protein MutS [Acidobacteria bacterium]|nr:DNA mismatch repair protein MutS [Acidobacteriota bacterium]